MTSGVLASRKAQRRDREATADENSHAEGRARFMKAP
jgi:hypothetical protein